MYNYRTFRLYRIAHTGVHPPAHQPLPRTDMGVDSPVSGREELSDPALPVAGEPPPPLTSKERTLSLGNDDHTVSLIDDDHISCLCIPPRRRERQGGPPVQPSKAPDSKANKKFAAELSAFAAEFNIGEANLLYVLSKLLLVNHPSDACGEQCTVLDGQQLDAAEAVTEWRKCRRRLRRLTQKLLEREQSHARLMSIRPGGVKESEVKAYQGLYQSMMRLRTDATKLRAQQQAAKEEVEQHEVETVVVGEKKIPRICVSHLYRLLLMTQRETSPERGPRLARLLLHGRGHKAHTHKSCAHGLELLDTPRGSEETPRNTDSSVQ